MHRLQQQPLTEEAHQLLKRIIEEMKREDEAMAETLDPNYLKDLGIFERACCGYKFGPQSQRAVTGHHHHENHNHHENNNHHENHHHHNSRHDTPENFAEEKETVVIAPKQQDRNRYGGCDKTEPELESERGWEWEREWECESELESESESESESEYGSDEYLASDEEELDDEEGEQETDVHDTDIWDYGELDRAILGSMEEEEESLRLRVDDDDQADQIPNPTLEPQMKQDHKNQDPAVKWRNRMKTLVSNGDEATDVLQVTKPFCGTTTHRVPKFSEESKEEPDDFMLKDRAEEPTETEIAIEAEKETEIEAEREETKVQEEHGASSIREISGNSLPKASLSCCLPGRPVARFPRSHRRGSNQP